MTTKPAPTVPPRTATATLAAQERHPLRAALPLFLAAGLVLCSLDATAKWLVRDWPLFLVVWARYAGQLVVVTPFAMHRAGARFWHTRRPGLQLVRSTMLLLATLCFFGGLRFLPLAEASSITFLLPVFVVLLAGPMLGERPTRARWLSVIGGFAGVMILLRPGSAVFHPAAALLVGTALFNALYNLLTRKLQAENPYTSLFYSALVGAIVLSLALPFAVERFAMSASTALLFALLGLFAGLGHFLLISAYQRAPASLLTPFTYLQMIWATLYGFVLFGQLPDQWSAFGMLVIVASGIGLALAEGRRAQFRG